MPLSQYVMDNPALSAAIISMVSAVLGYFYRDRKLKKQNLRTALYVLLRIWHPLTALYANKFDDIFGALLDRLEERVPGLKFTEEQRASALDQFSPLIERIVHNGIIGGPNEYATQYGEAVKLISLSDPILAYQIGSAGGAKEFLQSIDEHLTAPLESIEAASDNEQLFLQITKDKVNSMGRIEDPPGSRRQYV